MLEASERQEYERAAALRDKVRAIERTMESQKMAAFARTDLDLLGLARRDHRAAVQLFVIRNGKAIGRDVFLLEAPRETTDAEIVSGFLNQYYGRATSIPKEILVPVELPDGADLEAFLTDRRAALVATARETGAPAAPSDIDLWVRSIDTAQTRRRGPLGEVRLAVPRRGERRKLLDLATRNADEAIAREQARWMADEGRTLRALEELADALGLAGPPLRIECYDISNVQGSDSVGSMVVFEEGRPRSGEYRRFRIKTVVGPNDFASHQEVLRRRFRRAKAGDEGAEEALRWAMPDLVIIDGGKGQVSAAKEVLDELGLHDLPLVGLAKEREELFLPGASEPIVLPSTSQALFLVQRLRDEAHRFAITYHRDLRSKRQTHSAFDDLEGVGPKRRRALLRVFGSAKRVREAPVEQIAAVPGIGAALAARIKAQLEA
jgi:excinuclease ABC subunit C